MSKETFTLVGGLVCDGTRKAIQPANVVVEGDRIARVGGRIVEGQQIDVTGLVVAPGFVDIHSHADWIAPLPEAWSLLAPMVRQGITTTAGGNCGSSPAPIEKVPDGGAMERVIWGFGDGWRLDWNWRSLSDFGNYVESRGLPLNLAMFVGHNTLRAQVMGEAERPATPSEIARMRSLAAGAVEDGGVGLSFGFEYFPGRCAGTDEAVAVASAIPRGVVAMHTRGLSALYSKGMNEALEIGERAKRRIQISHVNPLGRAHRSAADELPSLLARARSSRVEINLDAVIYTVFKKNWLTLFPTSVSESFGPDGIRALAASPEGRDRLRAMVDGCVPRWPSWAPGAETKNTIVDTGWDDLILCETGAPGFEREIGRSMAALARDHNSDPFELLCELITVDPQGTTFVSAWVAGDMVDDEPTQRLLSLDGMIPATDATPTAAPGGLPALDMPNAYGTMPRFLGRFCRDLQLFSLEEAIWRMTSLPAEWLQLEGRGRLGEGCHADIVVFDPSTIGDRGSLVRPEPPAGIEWVFVNGAPVVHAGVLDSRCAGRFVRPEPQSA